MPSKRQQVYTPEQYEEKLKKARQRYAKNPSPILIRGKKWNLKQHGLTIRDYWDLANRQDNKCAICGRNEGWALSVDHNYLNGKVRGLLCRQCNRALGSFQDDPILLLKAVSYLILRKNGCRIKDREIAQIRPEDK